MKPFKCTKPRARYVAGITGRGSTLRAKPSEGGRGVGFSPSLWLIYLGNPRQAW